MKKIAVALIATLVLSGCAATGASYGEYLAANNALTPDKGRITVYRTQESAQYSARSAAVKLNGNAVGSCDYAGFNIFDVTPGKYLVTVDMWDSPGTCTLPIEVVAGENHYLEIKPRVGNLLSGFAFGLIGSAAESAGRECGGAFSVEVVRKEFAIPRLSELKMTK